VPGNAAETHNSSVQCPSNNKKPPLANTATRRHTNPTQPHPRGRLPVKGLLLQTRIPVNTAYAIGVAFAYALVSIFVRMAYDGGSNVLTVITARALFVLVAAAPEALRVHLTVFALAIVIGYYVIGNVHHALHTPLMSVTNAISGIIVVGALLQIGHGDTVITALSFVAILLASINVFGGFAVTRRMLSMFSRS